MERVIIGFFDTSKQAKIAVEQVKSLGISDSQIKTSHDQTHGSDQVADRSFGDRVTAFFNRMLGIGMSEEDAGIYAEGVRRGGFVVTVTANELEADRIANILQNTGAVDVDRRSQFYRERGFEQFVSQTPLYNETQIQDDRAEYSDWERRQFGERESEKVIPVMDENVEIGKKAFESGRVRILSRVTETPVDQDITLKEERVDVERRPVDRPISMSDMEAFKEGEIILKETSEEPSIEKVARVVEEVVVRKNIDERTERIHETARRSDVEVERLDGEQRRALPEKEPRKMG